MADKKPLDPSFLKKAIRANIDKFKKATVADLSLEDLFTGSLALSAAVKKIFYEKSQSKFSAEPIVVKKNIVQFAKRMRVDGLSKFDSTTVIAAVNFFTDAKSLERETPCGTIIVYIERTYLPDMLRLLKYPYINDDDDMDVLDGAGAIINLIAGAFKRELININFQDLEMSHFQSYLNQAINGIAFPFNQRYGYEISFDIEGVRRLNIEMVMDFTTIKRKL